MFSDPRRCPAHPNVITSSADGMHDAPCGHCEYLMSLPTEEEMIEMGYTLVDGVWHKEGEEDNWMAFPDSLQGDDDGDIPF